MFSGMYVKPTIIAGKVKYAMTFFAAGGQTNEFPQFRVVLICS